MLSQNEASAALQGHGGDTHRPKRTAALTLGPVGIVYGDIGTRPLYAFREALRSAAVSLLLWALILIVTLKYVLFLLRADNHGEGRI